MEPGEGVRGVGPVWGGELGEDVFVFFVWVGGGSWGGLGGCVEGGNGGLGAEGEEEGHFGGGMVCRACCIVCRGGSRVVDSR